MNFLRSKAAPERAMPSNMTVAPPSGTVELAEAENVQVSGLEVIFGSWLVKLQLNVVGTSKPLPVTVPLPLTTTKPFTPAVPPWAVTEETARSNVNPPTDQRKKLAPGPVAKFQFAKLLNEAEVFKAMEEKLPESKVTIGLIQEVTAVAVAAEPVLNVTAPVKPIALLG